MADVGWQLTAMGTSQHQLSAVWDGESREWCQPSWVQYLIVKQDVITALPDELLNCSYAHAVRHSLQHKNKTWQ